MSECAISCYLHDYLEIACLYGYQVKVSLNGCENIEGKALDLQTIDKREYLLIEGKTPHRIELNQLKKLQVLTPNAKFTEVNF
jgi:Rho-binding antiterminator